MKTFIKNLTKRTIKHLNAALPSKQDTIIRAAEYTIQEAELVKLKAKNEKNTVQNRISIEELCVNLAQYDIISFDVFDTLIFRAFSDFKVLFDLWGEHFQIQYGRKIRTESERDARSHIIDQEITLRDIYERVSARSGIELKKGMQKEIDLELAYCKPNPYMYNLYKKMLETGKTIIITCDMFLDQEIIEKMLKKCGYDNWDALYVSSNLKKSKAKGDLYPYITSLHGKNKTYIHIGDNKKSDIVNAENAGWNSYYYENIHSIGKKFLPDNMSTITGALYGGITNAYLYSGFYTIDPYYSLGFVHFGMLVYGYCSWLNKIARETNSDCIMFAARDMYVIEKVYKKFFYSIPSHYTIVSRLAIMRADFAKSSEMFLTCLKDASAFNPDIQINTYFEKIGFRFLLPLLKNYKLTESEKIINTFDTLKELIYDNKDLILQNLKEDNLAGISYYKNIFENTNHPKTILFADMNGRCTSTLGIQHLLNDAKCNTQIIGAHLYSISVKGFVDVKLSHDTLKTYLFSYSNNRELYRKFQKNGIINTRIIESIFTAPSESLQSYTENYQDLQHPDSCLTPANLNKIHQGIIDFAEQYHQWASVSKKEMSISPYDAFMPVEQILGLIPDKFPDLLSSMTLGS